MRPRTKAGLRAASIVAIGSLLSGCAAGGYDAGALERHLVGAGVAPAAAKCVVDQMAPRFGEERLGARSEPSAAELAVERALFRRCGVRLRGR